MEQSGICKLLAKQESCRNPTQDRPKNEMEFQGILQNAENTNHLLQPADELPDGHLQIGVTCLIEPAERSAGP